MAVYACHFCRDHRQELGCHKRFKHVKHCMTTVAIFKQKHTRWSFTILVVNYLYLNQIVLTQNTYGYYGQQFETIVLILNVIHVCFTGEQLPDRRISSTRGSHKHNNETHISIPEPFTFHIFQKQSIKNVELFTQITSSMETKVRPLHEHVTNTKSEERLVKWYITFHFHNYALHCPLKQPTPKSIKHLYIQFLTALTSFLHSTFSQNNKNESIFSLQYITPVKITQN